MIWTKYRLTALAVLIAILLSVICAYYTVSAASTQTAPQIFTIEKGQSLSRTARRLDENALISSALLFRIWVQLQGKAGLLQAGEYEIPAHASMRELVDLFTKGQVKLHPITIAEGLTSTQIIAQLNNNPLLTGDIAETPSEGMLLPETYLVARGTQRAALIADMQRNLQTVLAELWRNRAIDLPFETPYEALILASIVEKETALEHERPLIASVFINRLQRGMRLQSDPTIIYGLVGGKGRLGRPIRLSEIKKPTAYNTYVIKHLPPTPIANVGRASLAAVLNPVASDYVYFVANGTGGHAFARNLAEHNRNVAAWRKIDKQK